MVVCYNKKCIFIHIPKTAGTSIEQFIKDNGKNEIEYLGVKNNRSMHHYTASELKKIEPHIFDIYYKFSIVRNPYERLLSEYYWCPIPDVGFKYGKTKVEFLNYVSKVVKGKRYFENIYNDHFIPQYMFVYNNKLIVDHIFRYEDLEWVIDFLKKKLNIERNFPTLNKLKITKSDWNENQKNRIYKLYKNDFILFNYEK
jgi:hypothetical protein